MRFPGHPGHPGRLGRLGQVRHLRRPAGPAARSSAMGTRAVSPVDWSRMNVAAAERARRQEAFVADLFAGVHRDGAAGTVLLVAGAADRDGRRHELAAVCELARELVEAGHGVVLTDTADPALTGAGPRAAARRAELLAATVAVVSTTPALDPGLVPAGVPALAWVVDHTTRWLANPRHALFDHLAGGSSVVATRLGAAARVVAPRPDTTTFRRAVSGAGVRRELVTVLAARPLGALAGPLGTLAGTGRLRIHAPADAVPAELAAHRLPPLRAVDRPGAFAASVAVVFCEPEPADVGDAVIGIGASEAAAAGAVPVVRSRVGLTEVGLGTAASFVSASTLDATLRTLLADVGATRARGARLAALVADRPPLDLLPAGPRATRRPLTLGFFPDLRATNPYQDMLYSGLAGVGVRAAPVADALADAVLRDDGGRLDAYAFHLHWTSAIVQDGTSVFDAADRLRRFRERIVDLRRRGGRLVWTIHNALPHELRYREPEIELCRFLAAEADLVHVMSEQTFAATAPWYSLPADRTVVIPHASYRGWYPDLMPRDEARRRLGLLPHEVGLLALGGIRPYRGLDRLLDVFETLSAGDARLRLLVAGRPGPGPGMAALVDRCVAHPRITGQFRHIPPAALQLWSRAADLAVLPYRSILNSGAFQLAQSFDLPVVAPRDGTLRALLDPACTIGFDPADTGDLRRAVEDGIELAADPVRAAAAREAARRTAAAYPPAAMGADFARALLAAVPGGPG